MRLWPCFILLVLFLASCGTVEGIPGIAATASLPPLTLPTATLPLPIDEIVAEEPAAVTVATATDTPATDTPVPTPPAIPTVQPTETPLPIVHLSVPESWQEQAEEIVDLYAQGSRPWVLQIVADDSAELQLINEESEFVVKAEPLALVVPFTSDWQSLGLEKAMEVVSAGHDHIAVMPWSDMPLGMKALRVDGRLPMDPAYAFHDFWSLSAAPGYEEAARELLPIVQSISADPVVHLAAVGDIMLDRSLGYALQRGDLDYPFSGVAEQLRAADITIGNVESALGDTGEAAAKRYPFRAPLEAAESLAMAGFDVVSLANNHAGDYGFEALLQAISLLEGQGVSAIGAGANAEAAHRPGVHEVKGLKVAFFSYAHVPVEASTGFDTESWTAAGDKPGIAWANPEEITADIVTVDDDIDLIVVALHSGFEYVSAPSEPQTAAAKAAIDAGADLVIGHHAHILQGIEFYGDGAIIYGTGNFAFDIDGPPETAIFDIWLDSDGVRQIEINPAIIRFGGQPRLAESWEDPAIISQVYYLTDLLNAK